MLTLCRVFFCVGTLTIHSYDIVFVHLCAKLYRGHYVLGWHVNHKGTRRLPPQNFHRDFICLNKCWIKAQTHP